MVNPVADASSNQGPNDSAAFNPATTSESTGGDASVSNLLEFLSTTVPHFSIQTSGPAGGANGGGVESMEELAGDGPVAILFLSSSVPQHANHLFLACRTLYWAAHR